MLLLPTSQSRCQNHLIIYWTGKTKKDRARLELQLRVRSVPHQGYLHYDSRHSEPTVEGVHLEVACLPERSLYKGNGWKSGERRTRAILDEVLKKTKHQNVCCIQTVVILNKCFQMGDLRTFREVLGSPNMITKNISRLIESWAFFFPPTVYWGET